MHLLLESRLNFILLFLLVDKNILSKINIPLIIEKNKLNFFERYFLQKDFNYEIPSLNSYLSEITTEAKKEIQKMEESYEQSSSSSEKISIWQKVSPFMNRYVLGLGATAITIGIGAMLFAKYYNTDYGNFVDFFKRAKENLTRK
jgi:hypothetical protein